MGGAPLLLRDAIFRFTNHIAFIRPDVIYLIINRIQNYVYKKTNYALLADSFI